MTNFPLLTIAIPTYNRVKLLKRALKSALAQTYPAIEIIVLDNASTDETQHYLECLTSEKFPLQIIRNENNIGFVGNVKQIPDYVNGKYLVVLSDDDYLEPDFAACAVEDLELNPDTTIWYCRFECRDHYNRKLFVSKKGKTREKGFRFIRRWLRGKYESCFSGIVFRMSKLREIGGFVSTSKTLDTATLFACAYGHMVLHCPKTLAYYAFDLTSVSVNLVACERLKVDYEAFIAVYKTIPLGYWERFYFSLCCCSYHLRVFFYRGLVLGEHKTIQTIRCLFFLMRYYPVSFSMNLITDVPFIIKGILYNFRTIFQKKPRSEIVSVLEDDLAAKWPDETEEQHQERLMARMIENVINVYYQSLDLYLWGNPYMVAAGEIFAEKLKACFKAENIPLGKIIVENREALTSDAYHKATRFVNELIRRQWNDALHEEDFFKEICEYRRQQ